ncbi:MAG TPA: ankyrin repeat domain-containing protein [Bryobacteraceae bacterium]|jgi:ankyrin repeat protein|nr:ankyrin repeat domain-containing protein [Bryobacteraceae bacterium]
MRRVPAILFAVGLATLAASGAELKVLPASSVVEAVKGGNVAVLQKTLQQHPDPNTAEADGTTALHWAVQKDRLDLVQALLAAGAKPNVKNRWGVSPLALAVATGSPGITKALLRAGADPRVSVPETGTPLLTAAHSGNPETIKALLAAGVKADETEESSGQTALMWAAAEDHVPAVQTLLGFGADVRKVSKKKESALFFAVRTGDVALAETLLEAGADINERAPSDDARSSPVGDSMLVTAIANGHFGMADFLLNKGADPNAAGTRWPPLHALVRIRNYEESQYPAPKTAEGDLDSLVLAKHLLARGEDPSAKAATKTARRNPGDMNYTEFKGATPFFLAAKAGDISMMRLLLSAKADYTTPIEEKTTPLMVAAGVGCVPGQWIEPEPAILAAVKLLVEELKADVNAVNIRHETALHGAVCRGADSVIQYLVDKGAKLDVKDVEGKTALDVALNGIFRGDSIGTPPVLLFKFPEHTAILMKKLAASE